MGGNDDQSCAEPKLISVRGPKPMVRQGFGSGRVSVPSFGAEFRCRVLVPGFGAEFRCRVSMKITLRTPDK